MSKPSDKAFDGKSFARRLPTGPGVYVMRATGGKALYVGKAGNLRKRVGSYFDARPKSERLMRMVAAIDSVEVSLTRTEGEALLLENEWIKSQHPRYNVLLRDDKSYPWLLVSTGHEFPRIAFHRGARGKGAEYLGPFPSAGSVRESINLIQKLFRLRNCEDSYFAHRRRPCLQHQIQRCTAPCVDLVSAADYQLQVDDALMFLRGGSQKVIKRLIARMDRAAGELDYERAARIRDQINTLKQVQAQQFVATLREDTDLIALERLGDKACAQVVSYRGGRHVGQRSFFPTQVKGHEDPGVLQAFVGQYYRERMPPPQLIVSHELPDRELFQEVFSERAGRKVRVQSRPRGERRQWLQLAQRNAANALELKLADGSRMAARFEALRDLLGLDEVPERVECFDVSHLSGGETVAACVSFDAHGPAKDRYRRFNIKGVTPGDDYAALAQALQRHYGKVIAGGGHLPDLLLIDGGRGQLSGALEVLAGLGLPAMPVVGIAKGPGRRAGYETWVRPEAGSELQPGPESMASHLVQQVRDEAHRFAITGHRGRRQRSSSRSVLEEIPGVGAGRRRALLTHFGGLKGVRAAGEAELASVPGISRELAARIFHALH